MRPPINRPSQVVSWVQQNASTVLILLGASILFNMTLLISTGSTPKSSKTSDSPMIAPNGNDLSRFWDTRGRDEDEKFTVFILNYDRDALAKRLVKHYAKSERVDRILLSWNNLERTPPSPSYFEAGSKPFFIVREARNTLNNRFRPNSLIQTDCVFNVDDDIEIPIDDLEFAFSIWQQHRDQLIGYYPRGHSQYPTYPDPCASKPDGKWHYSQNCYTEGTSGDAVYLGKKPAEFSIVLDSAIFMHRLYNDMYTNELPQRARDLVDETRNCEDLVLPYMMSNHTRTGPILVSSPTVDGRTEHLQFENKKGHHEGLNRQGGHYQKRNRCMQELVEIFGYQPLVNTNYKVMRVTPEEVL
eukprot:TRINITY_DN379_c0_g2_i1.p1 TRINITY_DN379_c0_g2~~TRINITY_DN379_c0_g2_i1.p1  ORF type:complete len:357 (-),score=73.81 TRINITY_DN379_c0_g2_i1:32-1102(-)